MADYDLVGGDFRVRCDLLRVDHSPGHDRTQHDLGQAGARSWQANRPVALSSGDRLGLRHGNRLAGCTDMTHSRAMTSTDAPRSAPR